MPTEEARGKMPAPHQQPGGKFAAAKPREWLCFFCKRWNPMARGFCVCGKFWQASERYSDWTTRG
jgi:hypothetical protein